MIVNKITILAHTKACGAVTKLSTYIMLTVWICKQTHTIVYLLVLGRHLNMCKYSREKLQPIYGTHKAFDIFSLKHTKAYTSRPPKKKKSFSCAIIVKYHFEQTSKEEIQTHSPAATLGPCRQPITWQHIRAFNQVYIFQVSNNATETSLSVEQLLGFSEILKTAQLNY